MSTLSEAFDVPVPFKDYGLDILFPKLDIDDHAKWCAEIHEARKPRELKLIPGNAAPVDRFKMQRSVEFSEPTLDDIDDLLYTPAGARACLDRSLAKAGKSDDDRKVILKKIPPGRAQRLALAVSGLYEKIPAPLPGAAPLSPPPSESPSGATSAPAAIGDGQDSSSPNTPEIQSDK
jgi:hypothetical protein